MTDFLRSPGRRGALLGVACLGLAGCVVEPANPYPPVPEPRPERIPPRPQASYVWQPGHYQWDGRGYRWEPGRYMDRPYGTHWVVGRWARANGRWVWVAPHWQ